MFFFRKAQRLYRDRPPKELSPAFWESEDRSPTQWEGFTAVLPAIEHELGQCQRVASLRPPSKLPRFHQEGCYTLLETLLVLSSTSWDS